MSHLILTDLATSSPFDSIRHFDAQGKKFWKGRELQKLLGYLKWQRFEDAIDRAKVSIINSEGSELSHINHLPGTVSGSGRTGDDKLEKQTLSLSLA